MQEKMRSCQQAQRTTHKKLNSMRLLETVGIHKTKNITAQIRRYL